MHEHFAGHSPREILEHARRIRAQRASSDSRTLCRRESRGLETATIYLITMMIDLTVTIFNSGAHVTINRDNCRLYGYNFERFSLFSTRLTEHFMFED